jgi:hypothetical protein
MSALPALLGFGALSVKAEIEARAHSTQDERPIVLCAGSGDCAHRDRGFERTFARSFRRI